MISIEEYFRTITEPDCEYVSGEIELRTPGDYDHSSWQAALLFYFFRYEKDLNIDALPSLRTRVAPDRFRVPDVTILSRNAPREQIITHPPLAVFEILSPEDLMSRMLEKLGDYERMGIGAIWLIEPKKQVYYHYHSGQLTPGTVFSLPGSSFSVPFSEIAALAE